MMVENGLRVLAIAIAIAACVDPAITRSMPQRQALRIVTMHADDVVQAERLQRRLSADYDVTIEVDNPTSLAAACPSTGGCLLVSRGDVPRRLSAGAVVLGALRVNAEGSGRTIRRIAVPQMAHLDAASSLHVALTEPVARVDVLDGGIIVGSAEPGESLEVDVTWVPLGPGARALRVVAGDDVEDVGVVIAAAPAAVFVYEPEATWTGTFVRRAIEDDRRFAVVGRTRVAPAVTVTRGGGGPLSAAAIGDAGTVVVTAPHTLSGSDVVLLDRFVTQRGGSLMLIPDQRPSGAVLRLIPRIAGQQRDAQPREVGLLRVREWLTFESGAGTTSLATLGSDPIVMSRAVGRGQVIVSGALDAWRLRDGTSSFNTFWTGLAWQAAVAAGTPLQVRAERVLARPGEPIRVEAELQSIERVPKELSASGSMTCEGQREAVRWWPGGWPGLFEGIVRPRGNGACELVVTINGVTTTFPLAVQNEVRRGAVREGALEAAMQAHGAVVAGIGELESSILARANAQLPATETSASTWPMRSPYWLIVFALCLASEWWLRRRAGLS
jgi:hypothetical protein